MATIYRQTNWTYVCKKCNQLNQGGDWLPGAGVPEDTDDVLDGTPDGVSHFCESCSEPFLPAPVPFS